MKICFLADADSIHTKRWCEHFHTLGYEVHLISFKKTVIPDIMCHFVDAGDISVGGGNWKVIFKTRKVKKLLKSIRPDILHAHYATSYGLVGALTRFHPYVVTTLGSDILISPVKSKIYQKIIRYVFRKADYITLMADHMKEIIKELNLGNLEKASVVPFGIDTQLFNSKGRNLPQNQFVITSTRNFETVYNIPHLLKAAAMVKDKIPNVRLNLIGDGSLRKEMERMVEELNLSSITTFYGKIPQVKIVEILNQTHIFVTVSLSDGNNISLNEAMACGAYCIASDIPANRQWLSEGENGRLIKTNDVKGLAEAILESYSGFDSVSERANELNAKIIREKADWNSNMQKVELIYKSLCGKN